jgi:hypothetical protein
MADEFDDFFNENPSQLLNAAMKDLVGEVTLLCCCS